MELFKGENHCQVLLISSSIIILLICLRCFVKKIKIKPDVLIGNAQIIGRRKEQEDYFAILPSDHGVIAALGDGMGGYSKGRMASSIAVNTYIREFSKLKELLSAESFFTKTARIVNNKIIEKSKGVKTGTTLVTAIIYEGNLYWSSVGDSAIILFRNGEFSNLNKKHIFESILEEQYLSGKITKEALKNNSKKKMLTNYLGHSGFKDIEIGNKSIALRPGDKVLLCSDGVYNCISELEMERILMKKISPHKAAQEIIEKITEKNRKHQDNATVIILEKNN